MADKKTIIVTGRNGQLGSELFDIANQYPQYKFSFFGKDELNICDGNELKNIFDKIQPAYFINCAAYTAVDKAESDRDNAIAINADAAGNIATLCKQHHTKLIHISTDYVFNGNGSNPYKEDDPTDPVNYYGYSKLLGERLALDNNEDTVVIRTSWVYSTYGNNFVKTMLRLMKERPEIRVVSDQVGSPTNAKDLAEAIMVIINNDDFEAGIYHFSNEGVISWHDFALTIKEIKGFNCTVHAIPTTGYPTPAKRPAYSVMSKEKIAATFPIRLKDWKAELEVCLAKL